MVLLPSTWGRHALAGDGGVAWLLVSYAFSRVSNVAQTGQTILREIKITNQEPVVAACQHSAMLFRHRCREVACGFWLIVFFVQYQHILAAGLACVALYRVFALCETVRRLHAPWKKKGSRITIHEIVYVYICINKNIYIYTSRHTDQDILHFVSTHNICSTLSYT